MTTTPNAIEHAIGEAGFTDAVDHTRTISASADQQVLELTLANDTRLIAKVTPRDSGDRLHAEAESLQAIGNQRTLLVPAIHALCDTDEHTVLLMEKLKPAPARIDEDAVWSRFAHELARHHQSTPPAPYGWTRDSFLGPTPQPNAPCDDWIEFNAYCRLGYQLERAEMQGHLTDHQANRINTVIQRLPDFLPWRPAPALIHGDLWSGNAIAAIDPQTNTPRIAVIDPAVSIGDAWADIAMMRLFGGFPPIFFETYHNANQDHDQLGYRLCVYQLYHALNHLNIFGTSYIRTVMNLVQRLLKR